LDDIELVTVRFAAYCDELDPPPANADDKKYSHQLSLLFELITKNPIEGDKEIFFAFGTKMVNGATSEIDTGVPCPPPPDPSKPCPGA